MKNSDSLPSSGRFSKKSHPKKSHNNITPKQKGHKGSNEVSAVIVEVTFAKAFLRKVLQNIDECPRYLLLKAQSKESSQAIYSMKYREPMRLHATLTHLTSPKRLMYNSTRLTVQNTSTKFPTRNHPPRKPISKHRREQTKPCIIKKLQSVAKDSAQNSSSNKNTEIKYQLPILHS